ncbi:lipo protein [Bifidobacterium leontopitheci]|uniref:Lipo protein n=2 Tax=Bifidobacterium leontopitheci TaxID=2650774 RepID=A0A6I1GK21_9BIFI|nr:lipo protein [Bifidobacterium leontopitheci]
MAVTLFALMVHAAVMRVPGMSGVRPSMQSAPQAAAKPADGRKHAGDSAALHKSAVPSYDPDKPFTAAQRRAILAAAERKATSSGKPQHRYQYCVSTRGDVGDTTEFAQTVYMTLNNPRGWPRAGLTFVQSDSGRCDMTYTLSQAQYMRTFSPICSPKYSCRAGDHVIVNYDRWRQPTESWLNGGGTLANYRTMVINHETGHKLDHRDNESVCTAPGKPAPLMQEQSMSLRGCTINPWPLDSELWAHW